MEFEIDSLIKSLQELKARADELGAIGVSVYSGHKDGSGANYVPDGHDPYDVRLVVEGLVNEGGNGNVNARLGSITVRTGDEDGIAIVED